MTKLNNITGCPSPERRKSREKETAFLFFFFPFVPSVFVI